MFNTDFMKIMNVHFFCLGYFVGGAHILSDSDHESVTTDRGYLCKFFFMLPSVHIGKQFSVLFFGLLASKECTQIRA